MSLSTHSVPGKNITGKRACNYYFKPGANFVLIGKRSILVCLEFYLRSAKFYEQIYCSVACIESPLVK
jgi:hypothetical protein